MQDENWRPPTNADIAGGIQEDLKARRGALGFLLLTGVE
jgi:hypothetical protein